MQEFAAASLPPKPPETAADHLCLGLSQLSLQREESALDPVKQTLGNLLQASGIEQVKELIAAVSEYLPEDSSDFQKEIMSTLLFCTDNPAGYSPIFQSSIESSVPTAVVLAGDLNISDPEVAGRVQKLYEAVLNLAGKKYRASPETRDKNLALAKQLADAFPTVITDHDDQSVALTKEFA